MNEPERRSCGIVARRLDSAEESGDAAKIATARQGVEQCMAMLESSTRPVEFKARLEKQRRDEAAKRAAEVQAKLDAHPLNEEVGLSAAVCAYKYERASAEQEIATERKYAAEGAGIVDMRKLHALQQRLRQADEGLARLNPRTPQPMPCDGEVREIADCVLNAAYSGVVPIEGICEFQTAQWAARQ